MQVLTPQEKLMNMLKDLPPDRLKEVIDFTEYLKTKEVKKTTGLKRRGRITLPTFHLGHITQDALNRGKLYGEHLNRKLG